MPWRSSGGVFRPLCMPHVPVVADRGELRRAVAEHRGLLAYWTSDWDSSGGDWWWTCCDRPDYDLDTIESARGRRSIRKGLRECTVRRMEAGNFARPAYPVYRGAVESYGGSVPTRAEYARRVERLAAYPGTEFWAAFRGQRMAAFATCQVVDNAVILGSTKSDPEFHRHNPNAALFYTIARHYLRQGRRYVSNGSRTLWHPSNINDFLLTLGFRKIHCRLHVQLSTVARLIDGSRVVAWGRFLGLARFAGGRWAQLEGFDRLVRIAKTFR
jgi:hypothetical protein